MSDIRNEDELPVDITDEQYNTWFKSSFVWQGVRMGPWPMPELKGCPFCGRQPRLSCRGATESERSTTGEIFFITCHCGGNTSKAWQYGHTLQAAQFDWNTRVESDNIIQ